MGGNFLGWGKRESILQGVRIVIVDDVSEKFSEAGDERDWSQIGLVLSSVG